VLPHSSFYPFPLLAFSYSRGSDAAPASRWYAIPQSVRNLGHRDADNRYVLTIDMFRLSATSRSTSFVPHFLILSSFLLPRRSMLFLAGDLAQWHLPVGMKDLDLSYTKVTGKATSD
jgi:hypothetical protein